MRFLLPLLLVLATISLSAQVGVNNPNPEQALDVNGKIRLADDGTTPDAGTIRYNAAEGDFEGHNGTGYVSLTKSSTVSETARSGAVYSFGINNDNSWQLFDQGVFWGSSGFPTNNNTAFSSTQTFVVEKIVITPVGQNSAVTDSYYVGVARSTTTGSRFNPQLFYRTNAGNGSLEITANRSPLLVIPPNNSMRAWNASTSPGDVRIVVYGVFVDDVSDYFGL